MCLPVGYYEFNQVLGSIPDNVTFKGGATGPFVSFNTVGVQPTQTTIAIRTDAGEFCTVNSINVVFEDCIFIYPDQVANSATTPLTYPLTINAVGGQNFSLIRCTIVNAYDAYADRPAK